MVSPSGHALAGEAVILQPCTSFSFYLIFFFLQQRSHKSKGNKFSPRRQQESGVTNKAVARRFASSISWPAAHLHALLRTVGLIRSDIWITTPPKKKVSLFGPTSMIVVLPSYGIKISANMEPDMEVGVCFCRSYKPHLFQHHAAWFRTPKKPACIIFALPTPFLI